MSTVSIFFFSPQSILIYITRNNRIISRFKLTKCFWKFFSVIYFLIISSLLSLSILLFRIVDMRRLLVTLNSFWSFFTPIFSDVDLPVDSKTASLFLCWSAIKDIGVKNSYFSISGIQSNSATFRFWKQILTFDVRSKGVWKLLQILMLEHIYCTYSVNRLRLIS